MKAASGALITLLQTSKSLIVADLFTFTLRNGVVARYTSQDKNIVFGGNTFLGSLAISRSGIKTAIGMDAQELAITIAAKSTDLINGTQILKAVLRGDFFGADVRLETVYMPTWGDTSAGSVVKFIGRVGPFDYVNDIATSFTAKSFVELLNAPNPLHVMQPSCYYNLFDAGCALSRAAFQTSSSIAAGTTVNQIVTAALGQATGYFDLGVIQFTSGVLNGWKFAIRQYVNPNTIFPYAPLPQVPATSDTIILVPGCDKLLGTCNTKFSNLVHYPGADFVPKPEAAI